jgi:hypothetical protein
VNNSRRAVLQGAPGIFFTKILIHYGTLVYSLCAFSAPQNYVLT